MVDRDVSEMEGCDWSIQQIGHGFDDVDPGVPGGPQGGLRVPNGAMSVSSKGDNEGSTLG